MKHAVLGSGCFRRWIVVGIVVFAVVTGALVLSVKFGCCCIGPADAIVRYMQTVEIAVTDLEGRPAAGVKVYSYVYTNPSPTHPDGWRDSTEDEAELRKRSPELFREVNHQPSASGCAVIPVLDVRTISVFPLIGPVPRKPEGVAGKLWVVAVDDGVNVDTIPLRLLPGSSGHGEHWHVEIRSISNPQEYSYSDGSNR